MQVLKFGGASVSTIDRIKIVGEILRGYRDQQTLVVISAMGKVTNSLEKVAEAFVEKRQLDAIHLFGVIKESHLTTAKYLLVRNYLATEKQLGGFFTEIEWLLHDKPSKSFDYYYDQIVSIGELLSTAILSAYLQESGISNQWVDVRDIFRTDDNFRDANIDWPITAEQVSAKIGPLFNTNHIVLTQGFIGATAENESTTLGREGSDYSAAIFANLLDAESLTIWKDVPGVMNADPKQFSDAQVISELNYDEVIEMAYYGAQVIHPKTIKPVQNKSIPLYVKCFLESAWPGTAIHNQSPKSLPAIIVFKEKQSLVHLHSKDFSFVGEKPIAALYHWLAEVKLKPNLIQSGAVSLQVCVDDNKEKIEKLAFLAAEMFDIHLETGLTLLTIRHYDDSTLMKLSAGRKVILKQQTIQTVQVLMR